MSSGLIEIMKGMTRNAKDWRTTVPGCIWCAFCLYYGHTHEIPIEDIAIPFMFGVWLIGGVNWPETKEKDNGNKP